MNSITSGVFSFLPRNPSLDQVTIMFFADNPALNGAVQMVIDAKTPAALGHALSTLDSLTGGRDQTTDVLSQLTECRVYKSQSDGLHPKIAARANELKRQGEEIAIVYDPERGTVQIRYGEITTIVSGGLQAQKYTQAETFNAKTGALMSNEKPIEREFDDKVITGKVDNFIPEKGIGYETYKSPLPSRYPDHQWVQKAQWNALRG